MRILFFLILAAPSLAWPAVQELKATGGEVDILAKGKPSFIKIRGSSTAVSGQLAIDGTKVDGRFEFDLATLDTGIGMRNEHMKTKYLEVQKYPKAVLNVQSVESLKNWSLAKPNLDGATFTGELTLHGVTRPVSGKFTMDAAGKVNAEFEVKLSDFQVAIPTFSGVTVADDVEIKVQINKFESL